MLLLLQVAIELQNWNPSKRRSFTMLLCMCLLHWVVVPFPRRACDWTASCFTSTVQLCSLIICLVMGFLVVSRQHCMWSFHVNDFIRHYSGIPLHLNPTTPTPPFAGAGLQAGPSAKKWRLARMNILRLLRRRTKKPSIVRAAVKAVETVAGLTAVSREAAKELRHMHLEVNCSCICPGTSCCWCQQAMDRSLP